MRKFASLALVACLALTLSTPADAGCKGKASRVQMTEMVPMTVMVPQTQMVPVTMTYKLKRVFAPRATACSPAPSNYAAPMARPCGG